MWWQTSISGYASLECEETDILLKVGYIIFIESSHRSLTFILFNSSRNSLIEHILVPIFANWRQPIFIPHFKNVANWNLQFLGVSIQNNELWYFTEKVVEYSYRIGMKRWYIESRDHLLNKRGHHVWNFAMAYYQEVNFRYFNIWFNLVQNNNIISKKIQF